jgi:hypothetical protein
LHRRRAGLESCALPIWRAALAKNQGLDHGHHQRGAELRRQVQCHDHVNSLSVVSAIAIDPAGNTSEFSQALDRIFGDGFDGG